MSPDDFLDYARNLTYSDSLSEAEIRSAISRAYYAVYHQALRLAETNGYYFSHDRGTGGHKQLIRFIFTDIKPQYLGRKISIEINNLMTKRTDADYKLSEGPPDLPAAQLAVAEADRLVKKICSAMQNTATESIKS